MVKVCVVNPNFFRSSGVTVAIRRIFESLPPADITQYFVDCDYGEETAETAWIPTSRFATFDLMSAHPAALVQACRRFLAWLQANEIKVVHVHHRRLAVVLNWLRLFGDYQLIYTGNLTYPFALWFWLFCPRVATGVTHSVIENLRRTTRATQLHLISNGVEFPVECPPVEAPLVRQTAICIARLEPVKGHDKLLAAWRLLLDRGHACRLLLIGEGSLRETLQRQAEALRIEQTVEFRGFHGDVMAHIRESLFAVLPSRVEGQAIVTLEAATQGRGSLVTNVDGSRDCVPPAHRLPNLVPFGDVAGLADALETWFANPAAAVAEGRIFFDYLKRTASNAVIGEQYRALYAQVAAL